MRVLGIALLMAALITSLAGLAHAPLSLTMILTLIFGHTGNALLLRYGKMSWKIILWLDIAIFVLYIVIGLSMRSILWGRLVS